MESIPNINKKNGDKMNEEKINEENMRPLTGVIPKCCNYMLFSFKVDVPKGILEANCPNCGDIQFKVKA